ncbi:hypothetical protein ULF88_02700 [Halopseudomonas pachastrellae]|nr:hypothetical protein [Halopseudomonas pachastrellae]
MQTALSITLISQTDALAHLQNELDELNGGTTDPGREAATVPAGLVGVYQFLFEEVTAGSGIQDGVIDEYQVTADGRLILPGGSELSNRCTPPNHTSRSPGMTAIPAWAMR